MIPESNVICEKCGGLITNADINADNYEKLEAVGFYRHRMCVLRLDTNPKDAIGRTKPPLGLVPSTLTIWVAQSMRIGAKKYEQYNWRKVPKVSAMVYIDAALRHLERLKDGDDEYIEDGVLQHHAGNVAACMGIFLDAQLNGNLLDDRPPKGKASELIERFTEKKK